MTPTKYDISKFDPLSKIVSASIIDMHEDIGKVQQTYFHWAARGLRKLRNESLPGYPRYALLTVNNSTKSSVLPVDFDKETFVGVISNGRKIPLLLRGDLSSPNYQEIECEDKCEKCNQNKAICDELTVTVEEDVIIVNDDVTGTKTVTKKLYPNGDYYLETVTPVWSVENEEVEYVTTKEFISAISLKSCGCLETTEENLEVVKSCCYDVYCKYFLSCDTSCTPNYGGYKIFEEQNIIQFDYKFGFDKVYMEYNGFIPRINGQLYVPKIAFETLVNWTKFKSVENRRNYPLSERQWFLDRYKTERSNMEQADGQISLDHLLQAFYSVPKFNTSNRP